MVAISLIKVKKMKKTIFTLVLFLFVIQTFSQTKHITGSVTDNKGEALPGATIMDITNAGPTTLGTITDFNGKFVLDLPENATAIMVSFVGYESQTVKINDNTNFKIVLSPSATELGDIVVTALGIKREKKALGYAFADVKGDELTENRDVNFINSLSNKVAGVTISQTAGGAGTSSRVIIRGIKSIGGNSQPLIIVDGVAIDNSSDGASWLGGVDYGNGLMDISPDDIETMSVLKGPNAAALYGSRAANGVIMITTKKGSTKDKIKVTVNSNFMFDRAYIFGDYQNEYGAGFGGNMPRNELSPEYVESLSPEDQQDVEIVVDSVGITHYYARYYYGTGSWGPKYTDTIKVLNWNDHFVDYKPQPDNVKDYFEKGFTATNTIAIESGSEKMNWRFSLLNLNNKGLKPNSKYGRTSLTYNMSSKMTDFFSFDFKVNYIREDAFNRVGQGDARTGARTFIWMPRSTDIHLLENDYMDANGFEQNWYYDDPWHTNPYWEAYKNYNNDNKDRFIAYIKGNFTITPWLSGFVRSSMDTYNSNRYSRIASNSLRAYGEGQYTEYLKKFKSLNHDFLLIANKSLNDNWSLSGNAGGNYYSYLSDKQISTIYGLAVPDFFTLNNAKNPDITKVFSLIYRKVIQSLYSSAQLSYKSIWFIELTARNDWSSTLPIENSSYFYPSVNTSFVFTDAFHINKKILPFGKIRFSYAYVGKDTDPYQLTSTYTNQAFGDQTTVYLSNNGKNPGLKPENTASWEIGTDLRFFNNRIGLDFTYYDELTVNQIVRSEVSKPSGFNTFIMNGGSIENKGIEFLLNVTPVETANFHWDLAFNYAKNQNKVVSLAEGLDQITITGESQIDVVAIPGRPYGEIIGTRLMRYENPNNPDDPNNGRPIIDENGMYVQDVRGVIGNITPDWTGGLSTNLKYHNISLSATVGVSVGGDIFSKTNKYGLDNGQFVETLEGRESWYNGTSDEQLAGTVGYVADGVLADGTENTKGIDPQFYWHQHKWGGIAELDIYDASYVKLRDVSVKYNLPSLMFENSFIQSISIALLAKNLWLIYSGVPNIDPEASFTSNNNGLGQEYSSMPPTRSIGFNLQIIF